MQPVQQEASGHELNPNPLLAMAGGERWPVHVCSSNHVRKLEQGAITNSEITVQRQYERSSWTEEIKKDQVPGRDQISCSFPYDVDESRVKTLSAILYLVLTSARNLICAKGPD